MGAILGQAVVTLVAIGYGVSAHSSWDTERQRRIDGERAAVAEMAVAMKAASDRLDKVERELKRCQLRVRRAAQRPPVASPAPAAPPARTETPVALSADEAYSLLAGPIAWTPAPRIEASPERVEVAARLTPVAAPAWCEGRHDLGRGTNFAPCPAPRSLTAAAAAQTAEAHARP
jgi:hypothetical protein